MFDPVGYCTIKRDADCTKPGIMGTPADWQGKDVRVMEFADHSKSVLVVSSDATKMAMFDYSDIFRQFKCGFAGDVITPPGLDEMAKYAYAMKVQTRKGGYNPLLRGMVIQASLMKGVFNDDFLFQKEKEERREMEHKLAFLHKVCRNYKTRGRKAKPRKAWRMLRHLRQKRGGQLTGLDYLDFSGLINMSTLTNLFTKRK
jgi:hypothetical protein